jgi:hypothetical protein
VGRSKRLDNNRIASLSGYGLDLMKGIEENFYSIRGIENAEKNGY